MSRGLKVRKPKKEWFRTLAYFQHFNLYIADEKEGKIEKDFYIVMPPMATRMEDESFKGWIRLCVNSHGVAFFWAYRAADGSSPWAETAEEAAKLAETCWVRIKAKTKPGEGFYEIRTSKEDLGEPALPATDADGYMRLLGAAVPNERRIASPDHPVYYKDIEGRL